MYSVATWNIRGLNRTPKQSEVRQVIHENHLNVCVILESHVNISKMECLCEGVFKIEMDFEWQPLQQWISNYYWME